MRHRFGRHRLGGGCSISQRLPVRLQRGEMLRYDRVAFNKGGVRALRGGPDFRSVILRKCGRTSFIFVQVVSVPLGSTALRTGSFLLATFLALSFLQKDVGFLAMGPGRAVVAIGACPMRWGPWGEVHRYPSIASGATARDELGALIRSSICGNTALAH